MVQSVLRCGRCNKPFDKQSTLKRHGYYCRSRRAGSITKSRSCISCASGKARCDNRRPQCSRCITKAIECNYPAKRIKVTGPRAHHSVDAPTEGWIVPPSIAPDSSSVKNRQEASNDGSVIFDGALATSDQEFANLEGGGLDWGDPNIDFTDFLYTHTNNGTIQYQSLGSPSLFRGSTPSTNQIVQAVSSLNVSIPTLPTDNVRSLIQRPQMKTGAQRITNLILHVLKSYPLMMLRHKTLPPFIHPHSFSPDVDVENNDMEPLTDCINLVNMISSGVQGSRKLFWKNVRLECEHLCAEPLKLNKWELLAAMQALTIYILIRLDEGETDHNNFDFLLLTTVIVIAKQLNCIVIINEGPDISWKDWIYEESRQRLCVVYRVVNMLVYFDPAAMCDHPTDIVLAPLPAKKQLWEARDEFVWQKENEREPGAQTAFALAANGELVKADEGQFSCSDDVLLDKSLDARTSLRSTANWEEWCTGMDGFGGLVMLAASLIA